MPGRAGCCRGCALPCGATLSGTPSTAPHRYTCRPAPKTGPHFPSPAPARPAGRAARPDLLLLPPPRGREPRRCIPPLHDGPRAAPALGISAGATPYSILCTHRGKLPSSRPLFCSKEAALMHLFSPTSSPTWSTCDFWHDRNKINSAGQYCEGQ